MSPNASKQSECVIERNCHLMFWTEHRAASVCFCSKEDANCSATGWCIVHHLSQQHWPAHWWRGRSNVLFRLLLSFFTVMEQQWSSKSACLLLHAMWYSSVKDRKGKSSPLIPPYSYTDLFCQKGLVKILSRADV